MILLVDNYDSFTYNLVQRIGELKLGLEIRVVRNDAMTPDVAQAECKPTHLIISPGPCTPNEAGYSCDYIRFFHGKIPILGVCLGHQAIGQVFGGKVLRAPRLMHGKTSEIRHDGKGVYNGLPNPFTATRYHSLIVDPAGWTRISSRRPGRSIRTS
jgi:anthranilate synthase/aminodeoxychorismate synthase-like glutamine amidotransferase